MNTATVAEQKLESLHIAKRRLEKKGKLLSFLRLFTFVMLIVGFYQFSTGSTWGLWLGFISLSVFIAAIFFDNNVGRQKKIVLQKIKINLDEIERAKGNFPKGHNGTEYIDESHAFSQDLDLFGPKSLFYQICRCSLGTSRDLLAKCLITLEKKEIVVERQLAIKELRAQLDWRQEFQSVLGLLDKEEQGYDSIIFQSEIKAKPPTFFEPILALVLSGLTISLGVAALIGTISIGFPIVAWLINFAVLAQYNLNLQKKVLETDSLFRFLTVFSKSLEIINRQKFTSELLRMHSQKISRQATRELLKLKQIVFLLESRFNQMWPLINIIFLIDFYSGWALKRWLSKNQEEMRSWIESLNHFEVLSSFAAYWDQNDTFQLPNLVEENSLWQGKSVGHPLIPGYKRITNDLSIESRVGLITGSNMSGKSTFLRTIGINTVMAWIGLPVCADKLTLSRFRLFTSMRTHDDLSQETSSFYAELKRLKGLFQHLEESKVVTLYLLDEILKGTNSHDRHIGARGIIERLSSKKVRGFISTHDLTLADEYDSDSHVQNYSFNSTMKNDELIFDYKLSQQKCYSTNASLLMKQMGIIE